MHRFFSAHAWSADQLGLTLARMIADWLVLPDAALEVVVDDTLFRRRGTRVYGALWTHDASQPGHVTDRASRSVASLAHRRASGHSRK